MVIAAYTMIVAPVFQTVVKPVFVGNVNARLPVEAVTKAVQSTRRNSVLSMKGHPTPAMGAISA